jgi:predicted amidophosphoribosyltransferase
MDRERRTVEVMIDLQCHDRHGTSNGLCPECDALRDYARERLKMCPYQEGKTTCAKCPTHCYKPAMREQIRAVMRYAGPRMPVRHPLMTVQHMLDGRRKEPVGARLAAGKRAKGTRRARP